MMKEIYIYLYFLLYILSDCQGNCFRYKAAFEKQVGKYPEMENINKQNHSIRKKK